VGGREGVEPLYNAMIHPISPAYFQTLGAKVIHGREFQPEDDTGEEMVAIVNQRTARYLFGETDVVGKVIQAGSDRVYTIVGVVEGVLHWGVPTGVAPNIYVPYAAVGSFSDIYHLMIRSSMEFEALAPRIREVIAAVDPSLPVEEIVPMRRRIEASRAGQRFLTILLSSFAGVALILATGGIYASVLYSVGQRRQEMGIRMALGAKGGQVVMMVLRGGLGLAITGTTIGLAASLGLSRILQSQLFGISATDPVTLAGVVLVLTTAAVLACAVPAVRASRADPRETLKVE
jgi:hypothetical protein